MRASVAPHGSHDPTAPELTRSALAVAAAVLLAIALGWSHGFLNPVSLVLATAAAVAALAAIALGSRAPRSLASPRVAAAILATGIALSLVYDATVPPGFYVPRGTLGTVRPLVVLAAVLTATLFWRTEHRVARGARFAAILAVFAFMGGIVILRTPEPMIDVWYFQQLGPAALLQGLDPYLVAYPNIYGPDSTAYSAAVLSPDQAYVLGNPYPPLTMLLGLPAVALSQDVRWVMLSAILLSAWAIRQLGRASLVAELAAVLLLVQPRALFVVEQSWTEPAVLATVLLTALAVAAWRRRDPARGPGGWALAGIAAGIALASKQYAPLLLLPFVFATPARGRWKAAALAAGVAALVIVPFVLWDPPAFWRSVLEFQLAQPFRPDALSWLSAAVALGGPVLPVWPAFLLALAVLAFAVRRATHLDQTILAGAVAWLVLVLFNKQAFCNYYWLVVGLLCAAAAAAGRAPAQPPSDATAEPS